jgi:serine/threonine-protein kinase
VVDHRSDLYSLGVSLYEMVTGQRPFQSDSEGAILAAHLLQEPKPPIELRPGLPTALNNIILTAMAKNPAQRFQSADAFRAALKIAGTSQAFAKPQEVLTDTMRPVESTLSSSYCFPEPVEAAPVVPAPTPTPVPPQAQPLPSVLGLSPPQSSYRGLYMGLGALIVVAVLVAGGLYPSHRNKVSAEGKAGSVVKTDASNLPSFSSGANVATDSIDTTQTNSGSAFTDAGATTLSAASTPVPAKSESSVTDANDSGSNVSRDPFRHIDLPDKTSAKTGLPHSRQKGEVVSAGERDTLSVSSDTGQVSAMRHDPNPTPSIPDTRAQSDNSKELEEMERQMEQLASRAGSVHDSLENLRRQQAAQGLGLRGDIASAQQRMDTYVGKAQAAIQKEDIRSSKKYMELAEPEVEKLEKFLGR